MSDSPIPEPVDPNDAVAQARALRWTSTAIAVATIFLLVFNATALRSWASSLKPSEATAEFAALATAWEAQTARLGLTAPRAFVHDLWARQRALTWRHAAGQASRDGPPT